VQPLGVLVSLLHRWLVCLPADIGRPPPQRPNHKHKGGHKRRETMGASAPVHMAPRASLLSSERIRLLNQSGEASSLVLETLLWSAALV
jgi:hypothetical protein